MNRFGAWLWPLCLLAAGAPVAGQGMDHDPWLNVGVMPKSEKFALRDGDHRFGNSKTPPPPASRDLGPGEQLRGGIFDMEWPAQVQRREGQWLWLKTPRGYRNESVRGWVNVDDVVKVDAAVAHYTEQIADAKTTESAAVYYWLRGRCLEEKYRDLTAAKADYRAAADSAPKPAAEILPPPNSFGSDPPASDSAKAAAMASLYLGSLLAQDTDPEPLDKTTADPPGKVDPPIDPEWVQRLESVVAYPQYLPPDTGRSVSFRLAEGYRTALAKWCDQNSLKHAEAATKAAKEKEQSKKAADAKQAADAAKEASDQAKAAADNAAKAAEGKTTKAESEAKLAADKAAKTAELKATEAADEAQKAAAEAKKAVEEAKTAADEAQAAAKPKDAVQNFKLALTEYALAGVPDLRGNPPPIQTGPGVWAEPFYGCGALLLKSCQIPEDQIAALPHPATESQGAGPAVAGARPDQPPAWTVDLPRNTQDRIHVLRLAIRYFDRAIAMDPDTIRRADDNDSAAFYSDRATAYLALSRGGKDSGAPAAGPTLELARKSAERSCELTYYSRTAPLETLAKVYAAMDDNSSAASYIYQAAAFTNDPAKRKQLLEEFKSNTKAAANSTSQLASSAVHNGQPGSISPDVRLKEVLKSLKDLPPEQIDALATSLSLAIAQIVQTSKAGEPPLDNTVANQTTGTSPAPAPITAPPNPAVKRPTTTTNTWWSEVPLDPSTFGGSRWRLAR
ncbi:MAG TPA: hypothetical protein VHV55_20620 [Pirellulales bacterium]|jgi:hypothetical protein|nr:hypothetical protein [Pirellulales bacterium]